MFTYLKWFFLIYHCIWFLVTAVMLFGWTYHRMQFWKCIAYNDSTKNCGLYCMVQRFPRINSLKIGKNCLSFGEHPSSSSVFSGVRVTRSLVLCVCFVDRCLSFCTLSFGHCVACSSSIYGFWLPLWYLQTRLTKLHSKTWNIQNNLLASN